MTVPNNRFSNPFFSIIIPVYNVENYLSQCIESVLAQRFENFELLLINDGSRDRSGEICDQYANQDQRIIIFHQKNQGVSAARNVGIEHAKGEWICFIDSDDYIGKEYLSSYFDKGRLEEKCLNIQGWQYFGTPTTVPHPVRFPDLVLNSENMPENIIKYKLFDNGTPWGKLFNRNLINRINLRFLTHLPVREDAMFVFQYRAHMDSIKTLTSSEYYYRLPGKRITASHQNHSYQVFLSIKEALPSLIKEVLEKYDVLNTPYGKQVLSYYKNSTCFSTVKSLYAFKIQRTERLKALRELFGDREYFNDYHYIKNKPVRILYFLQNKVSIKGFDCLCYLFLRSYYKLIKK